MRQVLTDDETNTTWRVTRRDSDAIEPDVKVAIQSLDAAIQRHERHMAGTEDTSTDSQQKMMDEMRAALQALTGSGQVVQASNRMDAHDGRVHRSDSGEMLRCVRTAEGFYLVEANVARPGVLRYLRADGTTVRELVPAEELHRVDSLSTLGRKPTTLEHPDSDVSPENVEQYGTGDVDGDVQVAQGGFVRVKLAFRRQDAIAALESGIRELSPGYSCRIDATPGVDPVYGAYDAVQRDRVYNHVALTRRARGGPEICLRLDSAVEIQPEVNVNPKLLALLALLVPSFKRADADVTPLADADIDAAIAGIAAMQSQLDKALPEAATAADLRARIAVLEGELAASKQQLASAQAAAGVAVTESVEDPTWTDADVAEMEVAGEADPLAMPDAAAVAADPALAPTDGMVRTDSVRRAIMRIGQERTSLEKMASSLRLDSAVVAKLGNAKLRKLVVETAMPSARKDGDSAYYRAASDLIAGGAPVGRKDAVADPNPYEGIEDAFKRRDSAAGAGADTRADGTPEQGFLSNIAEQFKARHARA